jgi:hypothetical protein
MGRILFVTSRDSKDFESRKPNSSPRYPSSYVAGIKASYSASYSSIITFDPKPPIGSTTRRRVITQKTTDYIYQDSLAKIILVTLYAKLCLSLCDDDAMDGQK